MQYFSNTKGVLYMWLTAGLLFILVQISLLVGAWRKTTASTDHASLFEARWLIGVQLFMFAVMVLYNTIALIEITLLGVRPSSIFDGVIALSLAITGIIILLRFRRRLTSPDARLLLGTGAKAIPQWLQAVGFLWLGSTGMHPATITAIVAMGALRLILAKQSLAQQSDENMKASYKMALRDFISIGAMAVAWTIARILNV